ncbi:Threonine/homoserine efflux transporter RhtA [Candidatus Kryptobacter tengchongensis]|nr:Threonine/homoserine efflux transporter RhtA [Candidatus Kryptobacter tengchongensis]
MKTGDLRGYLSIATATLFWGFSATIAKFLFKHEVDLLTLVQMRSTLSFVVLFLILFALKREYVKISKSDIPRFALLGVIGIAGSNFTYYFTLNQINVATAIIMQYTAPVLVVLYAVLSGSERVTPVKIISTILSLVGCSLVVRIFDVQFLNLSKIGVISGVASALCWAFFNIYGKRISSRYNIWTNLTFGLMFAGLFWLFFNPPWKIFNSGYTLNDWLIFFAFAMISVLIPYFFYFNGLKHILSSSAIITSTLEPVIAIVSAWIIVGEKLSLIQIVGSVLVLKSVVLLQIKRETS